MEKYNKRFLHLFLFAVACSIPLFLISPEAQNSLFFLSFADFGADYFNPCRYVAELDPYGNTINGPTEHAGLPLWYAVCYIRSLTADYSSMSLQNCWNNFYGCILPLITLTILRLGILCYSLHLLSKRYGIKHIYMIPLFLSSILLFSIERGNDILLMAALVNIFIIYYYSTNPIKKYGAIFILSYVGICKIIPGILCLLYIKDKRYKEFFALAALTIALTFLPFLLFKGGFDNIILVPERMALQVETYGRNMSAYRFGLVALAADAYCYLQKPVFFSIAKVASLLLLLSSVFLFFVSKNRKTDYLYLLFVLALYAGSANVYNDLYLFPLFLYVLSLGDSRKKAILLTLFFMVFQPIQVTCQGHSVTYIFANICSISLWVYVLYLGFCQHCHRS